MFSETFELTLYDWLDIFSNVIYELNDPLFYYNLDLLGPKTKYFNSILYTIPLTFMVF